MRLSRIVIALLLFSITAVAAAPASAAQPVYFTGLDGRQEVPANSSRAFGQAFFSVSNDGETLTYTLTVFNLRNVVAAHIHLGAEGVNGPVVAFLYSAAPSGRIDGFLAQGTITAENLIGPLAGQPLSALLDQMDAGNAYVNIHTTAFPGGEIRGQI